MPTTKSKISAAALCVGIAAGVPATAGAHGQKGFERASSSSDVPARVASKFRRAEKALDRAQERADDGNTTGAVSQLIAVRRNLAAALKAAQRRTVAGSDTGVGADEAVATAQHNVIIGSVDLLDGATGELAEGAITTLDAAVDGRDALVGSISALEDAEEAEYAEIYEDIVDDATEEVETFSDALADDELTNEAGTAVTDASTRVEATRTAAQARVDTLDAADTDAEFSGDDDGDRPRHGGGRHGRGHHGDHFGGRPPVQDEETPPGDSGTVQP